MRDILSQSIYAVASGAINLLKISCAELGLLLKKDGGIIYFIISAYNLDIISHILEMGNAESTDNDQDDQDDTMIDEFINRLRPTTFSMPTYNMPAILDDIETYLIMRAGMQILLDDAIKEGGAAAADTTLYVREIQEFTNHIQGLLAILDETHKTQLYEWSAEFGFTI